MLDTWAQSYWAAPAVRGMSRRDYFPAMHAQIARLLSRSAVIIACDADDPDTIVGWACVEGECLHYLHTRKELRGQGISRQLLAEAGALSVYSHVSRHLDRGRVPQGWAYQPFRAWR